ncbi:hypothetical protein BI040_gp05 [Escherichia phage vB_EcoS_NBD2]|uniref:Uncharacterized protein n=1 Tax=Escherichia phage vB_EcoS_NBD2 TaxID=1852563 RepID=A0A192Y871_9CAUD|nr:hypothetical protein BI040_gp05 [Escherichia phage vB_EcoS_NBD2]ANM45847.1 hypothetical protein NBD2_05 [Escherichia phage vB_EcoS_NBD2]
MSSAEKCRLIRLNQAACRFARSVNFATIWLTMIIAECTSSRTPKRGKSLSALAALVSVRSGSTIAVKIAGAKTNDSTNC